MASLRWWNSRCVLPLWLLCVFSSQQLSWTETSHAWFQNQCFSKPKAGVIASNVSLYGLIVNLTAICERDTALLYFDTGGLRVRALRAAQECTVLNTNETDWEVAVSGSRPADKYLNETIVSAPLFHEHPLQDSYIECQYFGCYHVDPNSYPDDDYVRRVIFPNATCTFSRDFSSIITPSSSSSSLMLTSSSPLSITSLVGSSSLPRVVTTPVGNSPSIGTSTVEPLGSNRSMAPPDSLTVNESQKSPTMSYIATITPVPVSSPSIAAVPAEASSPDIQGIGSAKLEWIILAVLIAVLVVSIIIFISCLIFTSKRYLSNSNKGYVYNAPANELFDKKFTPVRVDPLSLSPSLSGISTTTKLDQLYENKENLDELESILNTPTESAEFSLPTDLSTDVLCECEDKHKCCRSYSEHTYLLGTPWVDKNGVVDDQHEVSALYLDSGCENDSGMMALMDDNNDARQLGEVATPAVDISDTRHFDGEAKSGRLSNGYLRCVSMYAGMEESSGVTDDLGCELELEAMLPLDDLGPIEQKLEDTSGYVSNDQLQHIDLQCHGDSLTVPPVLQ